MYVVRVTRPDPLFKGLGKTFRVAESHYWEVRKPGKDLVPIAATDDVKVQAFVHRTRCLYGVQFHPERGTKAYPDGLSLLRNFFGIARKAVRKRLPAGSLPGINPPGT